MGWLELYPHQEKALDKMKNGCILCGGVGSGKSRTSLAYYYLRMGGDPKSEKFDILHTPPKPLFIITTAQKRDKHEWDFELVPFLMSPYIENDIYHHTVVIDSWNNIDKYSDIKDSFFIFDEQRLVGYGAWAHSFIKIAKNNEWILLSATPGDCWMDYMTVFIANGFFKNKTDFVDQHVIYDWRVPKYQRVADYRQKGKLINYRRSILVDMEFDRHTVQHHETIYVNYDKEKYKSICKLRWNPWTDKPIDNASEFCQCLRRVVNEDDSRKEILLDICKLSPRVIVFYTYDYELEILKKLPYEEGTKLAQWNGHHHQEIPDSIRWVYLVQYVAGCEGWNCVKTDTIVFYSQTYSYRQLTQAAGRIDRLNTQYKDLYYYHLKSRAGIDVAIGDAIKNKKIFNEQRFYQKGAKYEDNE